MVQITKVEWQEVVSICDNLPEGVKFSPATPFAFTEYFRNFGVVIELPQIIKKFHKYSHN